jgi:hypothetical protein
VRYGGSGRVVPSWWSMVDHGGPSRGATSALIPGSPELRGTPSNSYGHERTYGACVKHRRSRCCVLLLRLQRGHPRQQP